MKSYLDGSRHYAEFLKKIYQGEKLKDESFSYRVFARKLGVSHGYLANIIKGARPPSRKFILDTGKVLELNENELAKFLNPYPMDTTTT
ncbi:MAG: hypothetical protein CME70_17450 [Halobacteriovorax sp.]|nr:hypothetical protein [Halobacteriovorax sp.]|tara:strand:- start:41704 stop:41970 length:267 start_codon:yes stop_codon:yes gene_type:complete